MELKLSGVSLESFRVYIEEVKLSGVSLESLESFRYKGACRASLLEEVKLSGVVLSSFLAIHRHALER